jgi:hypothetical protein
MAQREALTKYYAPAESVLDYLKKIRQPTLIVQGSNDVIVPTVNSYILQQNLPNAELIVYPDANHGSFCQYPELFVSEADSSSRRRCKMAVRICGRLSGCRFPPSSPLQEFNRPKQRRRQSSPSDREKPSS